MNKLGKNIMLAAVLAAFVSGTMLTPNVNVVFAAEQTSEQEQQTPPTNAQQNDGNEHAGYNAPQSQDTKLKKLSYAPFRVF